MLDKKTIIYGQWKKLSNAGENGIAQIGKILGNVSPVVLIAHTDSAQTPTDDIPFASATDLAIDKAIHLLTGDVSDDLNVDNGSDIYYATIQQPGESVELITDFG
jgi:hypothetical protein